LGNILSTGPTYTTTNRYMDTALIRESVRRRLKDGRLPQGRAGGIRETSGDGQQCNACDEPIGQKQQALWAVISRDWMFFRFHVDCYKVWDAERLALFEKDGEGTRPSPPPGTSVGDLLPS
jgi:hypothetical protein